MKNRAKTEIGESLKSLFPGGLAGRLLEPSVSTPVLCLHIQYRAEIHYSITGLSLGAWV